MSRKNEPGTELPISLGAMLPGGRAGDRPVDYKKVKADTLAKLQKIVDKKNVELAQKAGEKT